MTPRRSATAEELEDSVDRQVAHWAREIRGLDPATEALVERIQKLNKYLKRSMADTAESTGITLEDWEILAKLRKFGPPHRRTPGQLAELVLLSPAAMTGRLDRLEQGGLIRRLPEPHDRRSVQIELTEAGLAAWSETVEAQALKERAFADVLSSDEKEKLNRLLKRLLLSFETGTAPEAG